MYIRLNSTQNNKKMYSPMQTGKAIALSPPQPQWPGCLTPQGPAPARLGDAPPLQGSGTTCGMTLPPVHRISSYYFLDTKAMFCNALCWSGTTQSVPRCICRLGCNSNDLAGKNTVTDFDSDRQATLPIHTRHWVEKFDCEMPTSHLIIDCSATQTYSDDRHVSKNMGCLARVHMAALP